MKKSIHVTPHGGKWQTIVANGERASKVTNTQAESIQFAQKMAKRKDTELVIHGRNGRIRQKNSYGNDPFPPRDLK